MKPKALGARARSDYSLVALDCTERLYVHKAVSLCEVLQQLRCENVSAGDRLSE